MTRFALFVFALATVASPPALHADLSLPAFFSDHMVLQRDRAAAIWGRANPGSEVSLTFKDSSVTTTAGSDGKWRAALPTGPADASGATLTITSGPESLSIQDVLVGEVWFASGQSNMVFTMDRVPAYAGLIAATQLPALRMFNAPLITSPVPLDDIDGAWAPASPETVPGFSAVAFFFARKLHTELGVPVGLIKSAWGGKPVETFTSRAALESLPGTKALVDATLEADAAYDHEAALAAYPQKLEAWQQTVVAWRAHPPAERGRLLKKPAPPKRPLDTEGKPGVLFDAMIHPFVGYTLRGAIWYQGESNAKPGAVPYDLTLPLLINDWRARWNDEFSFYFVQLANFREPSTEPGTPDSWPLLQDRMRRILDSTPKTGMAITNDVGEVDDIHPKNKQDPGERLALWALAKDYGRDLVHCGPLFRSREVSGDAILVTFAETGDGLASRDGGPLQRFEIAGSDRVWHWAEASIAAPDRVRVSSPAVPAPVAVRYAWASNPEGANLVNRAGLPASVFRTDDWDDAEPKVDTTAADIQAKRRALATEIKALNTQRTSLDRTNEAYQTLTQQIRTLQTEFKATLPQPPAAP